MAAGGTGSAAAAAAAALRSARALVFLSGAGLGADSGLPTFRGPEGFWRAYPPFAARGLHFHEVSTPRWFDDDPALAWGFFGHRYSLYTSAAPHDGYAILTRLASRLDPVPELGLGDSAAPAWSFTSNVDGHWARSGFPPAQILEVHGSLMHLQCVRARCPDEPGVWPVPDDFAVAVDPDTFRASDPLPVCVGCGGLARPNVLMFGDWQFNDERTHGQELAYAQFCDSLTSWAGLSPGNNVAIIEIGAGKGVPTVRHQSESLASALGFRATLIRINPADPDIPSSIGDAEGISIAAGGLDSLRAIESLLDAEPEPQP